MHSIKYSNQAKIDIEEAISHIAKESTTNALNYLSGYEEKIEILLLNPYMGVACKAKKINRDCKVLIYKSHLVIYRVDKDKREVFIIRIYHASEDYISKFNEGEKQMIKGYHYHLTPRSLSGYEEKIEILLLNPYMGVACKAKKINRDCKVLIYKSHLVIYRVDKDKREVLIIRIYHASEDYISKFNEGEKQMIEGYHYHLTPRSQLLLKYTKKIEQ